MADWESMTDDELNAFARDPVKVEAETQGEREKLQIEWCKRNRVQWTMPDGSIGYEPPEEG